MGVYLREAGEPPQGQGPLPPARGMCGPGRAIDPDSRLIVSWLVGDRDQDAADAFVHDVRSRVVGSPQITTDGFGPYIDSVTGAFGRGVGLRAAGQGCSTRTSPPPPP